VAHGVVNDLQSFLEDKKRFVYTPEHKHVMEKLMALLGAIQWSSSTGSR